MCYKYIPFRPLQIVNEKNEIWKEENRANNDKSRENDDFEGETTDARRRIFIEHIFHLAANGELTMQDIEDESSSMILAASETVSNSLSLLLLCLATHPDCQHKLQQEIDETYDLKRMGECKIVVTWKLVVFVLHT